VLHTATLSEIELSEYCRSEGLYPEKIAAWRQACTLKAPYFGAFRPPSHGSRSEQKQLNTWVSFQSAEQPLLDQFSVSGNTVSKDMEHFSFWPRSKESLAVRSAFFVRCPHKSKHPEQVGAFAWPSRVHFHTVCSASFFVSIIAGLQPSSRS